jgi:hypothetical protein
MKHLGDTQVGSARRKWLLLVGCAVGVFLVSVVSTVLVDGSPDSQRQLGHEWHHAAPLVKVDWMAAIGTLHY